jgi:hypothetical protein
MTPPTATVLLVFGRGVIGGGDRYTLTPASAARVQAVVDYVHAHATSFAEAARNGQPPRVIFSGGWAEACEAAGEPPAGSREGDLMLQQARVAGLDRHAELHAETRSRSTLENLLHTVEDGLLSGHVFSADRPLGLVSHAWHLPRVRFLAGKVLRLRGAALLNVPATGGELATLWRSERAVHLVSRLAYLGIQDTAELLRRERRLVASMRQAERLARRGRGAGQERTGTTTALDRVANPTRGRAGDGV